MQISEKNYRENPMKIKDKSSFARLRWINKVKEENEFFSDKQKTTSSKKINNTK